MSLTAGWNEIPKNMARIQEILRHGEFKKAMEWIDVLEKDRIFCGHGMGHLLDVARIAWIDNLEQAAGFRKDVVYAAGLLHDVGKYLQYKEGIPHHISSEKLARQILADAGFDGDESAIICQAILSHRDRAEAWTSPLGRMIYRADKISRPCYACAASAECNWSEEKRTAGVIA
ncbi:HD domain-containing protein [Frisingicoccus sp.]|uniref:HD domain-containing protein n=1 Tax=Frisingicoccus sp. TaxID=1918627 RepID=UPI003AB9113C